MSFLSKHYVTSQIAERVFALINRPGGWGIGNIGIVDLGGKTLIFDTSTTLTSAIDAKTLAEELLARPVDLCSHYHSYHVWSNHVLTKISVPNQFDDWQMGYFFYINLRHLVNFFQIRLSVTFSILGLKRGDCS